MLKEVKHLGVKDIAVINTLSIMLLSESNCAFTQMLMNINIQHHKCQNQSKSYQIVAGVLLSSHLHKVVIVLSETVYFIFETQLSLKYSFCYVLFHINT